MANGPPVESKPTTIPFEAPNFKWEEFEAFFCQFLEAHPTIEGREIKSARRYGVQGGKQEGIDLLATVEGPSGTEEWTFQCKHVKNWTDKKTETAIKKHAYPTATLRFLLITSSVNEKARKPLEGQSEWRLWDGRQISGEFFKLQPRQAAANIAHRCFGPAWAQALFAISGRGSLLTPEAYFACNQDRDNLVVHDYPLVGRQTQLLEMDAFVKESKARVLILPGRGGMGKSRLLKEWAGGWRQRFKQGACWFARGDAAGLLEQMESLGESPVVVLDDAHLHPALRDGVLSALAQIPGAKFMCTTRPGGEEEIIQKALDHSFDRRQVHQLDELPRLTAQEAKSLAEIFLGPRLALHAPSWIPLVQDCPVFALIAAREVRERGGYAFAQINNQDIREAVFARMDRHVPEELRRSGHPLLKALALLGPIREPADFLSFWGKHTGKPQSELDGVLEQLAGAGLVERGKWDLHVVPEIYADYLAHNAVFNSSGADTGFLGEVMQTLGDSLFDPKQPWLRNLARNLAQAQWLMHQKDEEAPDLFSRVQERVKARVNAMAKLERMKLLDQWVEVASAQPSAALDLVRHIWTSVEIQAEPKGWETPQLLRASIQVILAAAQHESPQVREALDLLWWLHRDPAVVAAQSGNQAIDAMAKLSTPALLQPPDAIHQALKWFEKWVRKECVPSSDKKFGWLMVTLAQPFLQRNLRSSHDVGMTVQIREMRIPPAFALEYQAGVLRACGILLQAGKPGYVDALLRIAKIGSHPVWTCLGENVVPARVHAEWVPLRLPFVTLFESIAIRYPSPMVRARVRCEIHKRERRPEEMAVLEEMRRIDHALPRTIEDDICRVFLEDTDGPAEAEHSRVEEDLGLDIPTQVARRMLAQGWTPERTFAILHDLLADPHVPEFRHEGLPDLTRSLIRQKPEWRAPALEWILAHPDSPVLAASCSVLLQVPVGDWRALSPWLDQTLASPVDRVRAEGIRACERASRGWGQCEPTRIREGIRKAIDCGGSLTFAATAWWLSAHLTDGVLDGEIWAQLPLPPEVGHAPSLLANALERSLSHLDHGQGEKAWRDLLTKVVSWPEPPRGILRDEVPGLHEAFPNVFLEFLLARAEHALMHPEHKDHSPLLVGRPGTPYPTIFEMQDVPPERWQRLVDVALVSAPVPTVVGQWISLLWFRGKQGGAPLYPLILERVRTSVAMNSLCWVLRLWPDEEAFRDPRRIRSLLEKSAVLGSECHELTRVSLLDLLCPGCGFANGAPDAHTLFHREELAESAQKYAGDPILGPFFRDALIAYDALVRRVSGK